MSKDTNSSGIRGLRASQWTLRHLLLIVLIFGLGIGWWVDHRRLSLQIPKTSSDVEVKVFSIVNGDARELAESMDQLFSANESSIAIATDLRTNSILVRAPADDLMVMEAILLKLESAEAHPRLTKRKPGLEGDE